MSFLLRCLFWLGLVVSQISDREGLSLTSLTQPARDGLAAGAEQLKDRAVASCRDNTEACLALAAKASGLMKPARPAELAADTLRDGDRSPAWRQPRAKKDGT